MCHEVAYSPSSKGKGQGFFRSNSGLGGSHEIYADRRNQMKVEGPFDSLRGINLGLFVWSITKGGGNHYRRDPPGLDSFT
ncbi:hypothetical protein ERO13_A04G054866v2 [Gossypium hirsutum]|nr:hypothetical protein ERO13_A04G054866v2 [Gossypium hirsutum]